MAERSPSEIARETLKLLAGRKLLPTPDNYQAIYHEVAGTRAPTAFPEESLRAVARALPAQTAGQQRVLAQFEAGITQRNWAGVQAALVGYANLSLVATTGAPPPPDPKPVVQLPADLQEQLARLIEYVLPAFSADDPRLLAQGQELIAFTRQPQPDLALLKTQLANFGFKLSFAAEDQQAVRTTLLGLLDLVFQNIAALGTDDAWLRGQATALIAAAAPPLTLRRLDDVQARLKDVIFKQTEAKARAIEAQDALRSLLAAFIERLSQMTTTSSAYATKIEECARAVSQAPTLAEMAPALEDAIGTARMMSMEARETRDALQAMREKTREADVTLNKLQTELDQLSALTRHDPLTGTLNRRGLDESAAREVAIARRRGTGLCVALLDVDNFKRINDQHGHGVGDAALVHLADVVRASLRPQDTVARYGGEEFVVLMPDTTLEDAIGSMRRLQRELTKRIFMQGSEKLLITFSAGVAQLTATDSPADAIERADSAMYLAKRAGKNRVLAA